MQTIQQLTERFYYLPPYQPTDRPILAAVVGDTYTLILDSGNSSAHAKLLKEQLADYGVHGDFVVLTHWHWDHVFGLHELGLPSIANSLTRDHMKEMQTLSWEDHALDQRVEAGIEIPFCADAIKLELGEDRTIFIPDPNSVFDQRVTINLGGVTCTIEKIGGDHSPDSNLLYIPEEKVLFLGDCLYANMYAEKWHYTIENIDRLLNKIDSLDAKTYFLSHHPKPLNQNEFASFRSRLKECARLTEKHRGKYDDIAKELPTRLGRNLNEEDLEILEYFVNGYR